MENITHPAEEQSPSQRPSSSRAALVRIAVWLLVIAALSISVRRDEWVCPVCNSTKDTISWRILFVIPLSQREENLKEQRAEEHAHEWSRRAYTERMLLGVLLKGVP